jgi:hypothetical protein
MKEAERDQINLLLSTALTDPEIRRLLLRGSRHELIDRGVPNRLAGMISEAQAQSIEELAATLLHMVPELESPRAWRTPLEPQSTLSREPVPAL